MSDPAAEIDIHIPLPDAGAVSAAEAKALRHRIGTALRPHILRRLTALAAVPDTDNTRIDRLELEMRLRQLDTYDLALDGVIHAAEPPVPAHEMPLDLAELDRSEARASARAALFFSPEARFNVHGPIMLAHAAALAERLLRPGEALAMLEAASFSRMVISQLRLTVVDLDSAAARGAREAMRAASISGRFALSSGRRLGFYGVQDHRRPVTRTAWINRAALALVPPGFAHRAEAGRFHVDMPAPKAPVAPMDRPRALMTALDALILLMMSETIHDGQTKMLVALRNLPLPPGLPERLLAGRRITFAPQRQKSRVWAGDIVMMPTELSFGDGEARARVFTAETIRPYYQLPVG
ncbi:MAG: hypothetical protein AAFR17_07880 [Pseudomonadota bacterium]